jgi:tetratricopeptide (TPR) repeat protein
MPTSEIDKLERRYAENPQGLTFAPLAEVHRKSGDIPRALELLRAGLELHPNYIPASIVLGRCHWDLGDLPAAESAFAHVLRLDDENVIALKSLADISERLERFAEAQRWLQRLVSVDRSNEEARQQLARLEAAKEQGDRKAGTAPAPRSGTELPHEIAAAEPRPVELKPPVPAATAAPEAVAPPEPESTEKEPASPTLEFLDTSEPPLAAAAGKPASPAAAEEPPPVDGLISQEFVPPKEATYRLHPELTQEFVSAREFPDRVDVETAEEVELRSSGAAEFRVPNAAEDFLERTAQMNTAREDTPLASAGPAPAMEAPDAGEPPPQAPLPELRAAERKESVPPPAEAPAKATAAGRFYSASETKGQSVAAFFRALLAARPPGTPPSSAPAESTAPIPTGQDAVSPSSALGKEGTTNPAATPASGQTKEGAVSFDDFFGFATGGASPLSQGSSDPSNDDLDQFQSWLQNLKR